MVDVQKSEIVAAPTGNRRRMMSLSLALTHWHLRGYWKLSRAIWPSYLCQQATQRSTERGELLDFAAYYIELDSTLIRRHLGRAVCQVRTIKGEVQKQKLGRLPERIVWEPLPKVPRVLLGDEFTKST